MTQRVNVEDHVEDLWKSLKDDLLSAADRICGWTKGPPRHQVTWCWNKDVDQAIKQKQQLWKEWKKGRYKELTYKLGKIQREQCMSQRKLQKKKEFVTSLTETTIEDKYLRLQNR